MKIKILLILIAVSTQQLLAQCDRERDSLALADLYLSTNGADWNKDWDLSLPMEEWQGVTLTSEGCVRLMSLGFTGIEGSLPAGLSVLSELESLSLNANSLTGAIPSSYGDFASLKKLNLGFNDLSGPIPEELGTIAYLEELSLSSNDLVGDIPLSIVDLTNLKYLRLSFNDLTGSIPSELGSMASLEELNLAANDLAGPIPAALVNLSNLSSLQLYGNDLTGALPNDIGNLTNLQHFSVSANELSGEIPESFGQLKKLRNFTLTNNNFTGTIPDVFYDFPDLWGFEIPVNNFTGTIPPSVASLPNLQTLSLHSNQLSGNLPEALGNLEKLDVVRLQGNNFTGCIPSSFNNLCEYEVKLEDNMGLSWSGDFEKFCTETDQIGAPCVDSEGNAAFINANCGCGELVSTDNVSKDLGMVISPNPVSTILSLNTGDEDLVSLQVISLSGKLVENIKSNTRTIDVSEYLEGVYVLKVQTEKAYQIIRFVKI